ncbi:hypothetical protein ACNKHX_07475 [Shigella flexneri]
MSLRNQRIYGWLRAQSASQTIREYRSQAEHVRDELTAKALAALEQGGDAQAITAGSGMETD